MGTHFLQTVSETFQGLGSLAFVGSSKNVTVHCVDEDTGLAFVDVADLALSNLIFYNCSARRNSTSRDFNTTRAYM